MKCTCGNNRFYASQKCYHNVITDELGNFIEDVDIFESENPYEPFECTKCGKKYESISHPILSATKQ